MSIVCSVYGCRSRFTKMKEKNCPKLGGTSMHHFPKKEETRRLWIQAIRRKDWTPMPHSRVCSEHFRKEDMDYTGQTRRIREGAVPCIFPSFPKYLQPKSHKRKPPKERVFLPAKPIHKLNNASSPVSQCVTGSDNMDSSISPQENMSSLNNVGNTNHTNLANSPHESSSSACSNLKTESSTEIKEVSLSDILSLPPCAVSPRERILINALYQKNISFDELTRRNNFLSIKLEDAKKVTKTLQQKIRRQATRLENNKQVIEDLSKKNAENEHASRLLREALPEDGYNILLRATKNSGEYDPLVRSFALPLYKCSPKAYHFIRTKFNKLLPSPRTVRQWLYANGETKSTDLASENSLTSETTSIKPNMELLKSPKQSLTIATTAIKPLEPEKISLVTAATAIKPLEPPKQSLIISTNSIEFNIKPLEPQKLSLATATTSIKPLEPQKLSLATATTSIKPLEAQEHTLTIATTSIEPKEP